MGNSKICGNCHYYANSPLHGPWCTKNRKEVSYLQTAYDCWTALEEKPTPTPEMTPAPEPKRSRGGRVKRHPNYVDRETGHTMKWCTNCNQYKHIDDFYLNKSKKDGRSGECKPCHDKMCAEAGRKYRAAKKLREAGRDVYLEPTAKTGALSSFSDQQLVEELNSRGWEVSLSLTKNV